MSAEYFLQKSDECIALARRGREMADQLDAMGNAFMAKAVEIDTDASREINRELKKNKK